MATPPNVVWRGSQNVTRIGRGRWKFNAQDVTCTLRYKGPYATVFANVPQIGNTVAGYTGFGVKVADVDLDEGEGSSGVMTVLLRNPYSLAVVANPSFQQVGDQIATLVWQPFKQRIESHRYCGTNKAPPGTAVSTDGHITQANYVQVTDGWNFNDYSKLIQAGMTEYDEGQPVLTLTSFSYSRPLDVGENNFAIDQPDATLLPIPSGDWQWLRGGDDLQRSEKLWRLVQSWTGFLPGNDRNSLYELLYDA